MRAMGFAALNPSYKTNRYVATRIRPSATAT